jgi:hypothetical protein
MKKGGGPIEPGDQWICGPHWNLVPRAMKRAYSRVRRRERKFGCDLPASLRIWRRIKIEVGAAPPLGWPGYRTRGPCGREPPKTAPGPGV